MFLGGDPGVSGALAAYWPKENRVVVFDMPVHKIDGKARIDLYELARQVDNLLLHDFPTRAVVESVNAMPKQGVSSSFAFGEAFGILKMSLAASFVPLVLVSPAKWKRAYRLTSDKDSSRKRASELFPHASDQWSLAKHHGRAEAVLLAHYGANCDAA